MMVLLQLRAILSAAMTMVPLSPASSSANDVPFPPQKMVSLRRCRSSTGVAHWAPAAGMTSAARIRTMSAFLCRQPINQSTPTPCRGPTLINDTVATQQASLRPRLAYHIVGYPRGLAGAAMNARNATDHCLEHLGAATQP